MAWKERDIERLYYNIGDVREMIGADATSQIRFWEDEFHLETKRGHSGNRKYTMEDIALLKLIKQAVKDLHIATVRRLLFEGGEARLQEVVDSLAKKKAHAANC